MRSLLCLMLLGMVASGGPLKVMTWNLHHGVGEDGKLDLERIAAKIVSEKPDLVALQEVDRNCARSGNVDQAAELERLTGMKAVFGKAMDLGNGEYGQAVLTKWPVVLCGDFNDVPDSEAMKLFIAPWSAVEKVGPPLTCPSAQPTVEIDHILIRGLKVVEKARVLDEKVASDHRPVVATVSPD